MLVQAESGVVSLTGTPDAPAKVGISIADIGSGLYAYSSILAALLQRGATGRGGRIDISMLECLTEWVMPPIYSWQGTGRIPERLGLRHNMLTPYGVYACADAAVNFSIQNEREWRRFCEQVLQTPELAEDPRFAGNGNRMQNRAAMDAIIDSVFSAHTRAEILARMDAAQIANSSVNDVAEVAAHPQLRVRRRWAQVDSPAGPIDALLPPHNLANAPSRMGPVPALGQHTAEILAELDSTQGVLPQ